MKNVNIALWLASIILCFGCKSNCSKTGIEALKQENYDLKAKVAEYEKEISYKNAIIENLQKINVNKTSGSPISLPTIDELRTLSSYNIQNVYKLLKKQSFYGVRIKGNTIIVTIAKNIFKSGSDKLSQKGENELKKLAKIINKYKPKSIKIEGYTDNTRLSRETASKFLDNYGLSSARAKESKYTLLKYLNFNSNNILVEGLGDSKPIASNETKAGQDTNRRLEIYLNY